MSYAFDPSGQSFSNQAIGETTALTKIATSNHLFAMFDFGPLFTESVKIKHIPLTGPARVLVKDVDWYPAFQFKAATQRTNRPVYAGIGLTDITLTGSVIISCQVLGGSYTPTLAQMNSVRAVENRDPNFTTWESVCTTRGIALPEFPVVDHPYNLAVSDEVRRTVESLAEIGLVVQLRPNLLTNPTAAVFIPSAAEVGLGQVKNYPLATPAQAAQGTNDQSYMTPKTTSEAVVERVRAALAANGYLYPVTYAAGLEVNSTNALYLYDGSVYAARASKLPFVTNGSFESEKFTRIRTLEHKPWNLWRYVITGNESKDAIGSVVVSTDQKMNTAVKTRMSINSAIEPIHGVDFFLDANVVHIHYPTAPGDIIELHWREQIEDAPAAKNYYKTFAVNSGNHSFTLTNITGIDLADLRFIVNDWGILAHGIDYSYDTPGADSVSVNISFPLSLGDVIEVMTLDACPSIGRFNIRNLMYVSKNA